MSESPIEKKQRLEHRGEGMEEMPTIIESEKNKIRYGTDCKCRWSGHKVLSLCGAHMEFVRNHYVQTTGTLMRVDDDGKMIDYEKIPEDHGFITTGDVRKMIELLEEYVETYSDQAVGGNPHATAVRVSLNAMIDALKKGML